MNLWIELLLQLWRSIAQLVVCLTADQVVKSRVGQITLMEIDEEMISMVILSLLQILKGFCHLLAKVYVHSAR